MDRGGENERAPECWDHIGVAQTEQANSYKAQCSSLRPFAGVFFSLSPSGHLFISFIVLANKQQEDAVFGSIYELSS